VFWLDSFCKVTQLFECFMRNDAHSPRAQATGASMSRRIFLDQLRRNGKFVVPLVATVALMVPLKARAY
jgi:hypothetical protein